MVDPEALIFMRAVLRMGATLILAFGVFGSFMFGVDETEESGFARWMDRLVVNSLKGMYFGAVTALCFFAYVACSLFALGYIHLF